MGGESENPAIQQEAANIPAMPQPVIEFASETPRLSQRRISTPHHLFYEISN
jgi:hypothetical protein